MTMVSEQVFRDRRQAGKLLARALAHYAGRKDVVVLGLPRGGVPVAAEVGAPGREELAVGAIAEGGVRVVNRQLAENLGLAEDDIDELARGEERELQRRVAIYRGGRRPVSVADRTVIVVDDGVATGATMRAGLQTVRARGAELVVAAAPVGAADSVDSLREDADEVVVLETPAWFNAVGQWYENFGQTSDEEVRACLGVKEAA